MTIQEGFVVVGVEPRERARNELGIHFFGVLQSLDGFWAVNDHLVVGIHQFATEGPNEPVAPEAVTRGIAQREARGCAFFFEGFQQLHEVVSVFREGVKACSFDLALAVNQHGTRSTEGNTNPFFAIGF